MIMISFIFFGNAFSMTYANSSSMRIWPGIATRSATAVRKDASPTKFSMSKYRNATVQIP